MSARYATAWNIALLAAVVNVFAAVATSTHRESRLTASLISITFLAIALGLWRVNKEYPNLNDGASLGGALGVISCSTMLVQGIPNWDDRGSASAVLFGGLIGIVLIVRYVYVVLSSASKKQDSIH